eukprot:CAMPEP_0113305906 /NCGR_PEP_ID=MMETSP0010_2-20120614/5364_1 /TAXON_ID=216773 ORGANISM="Corethron hystrix, Strain 308" /NCGR_SAMPLE_ID=MMETSP0010_2 /ASSEMBLY_ACC=CAM_ASM_000155 /LENGTH=664 /DNA_ID=CAMNT_0000160455 /DNA_START=125 /DNA_END=2119 /DNA_ORIENTATION=- /assembly_acc=CAM_ASM_000155
MQPDAAADGSQKNGSRHDDPMAMCSLPSSYQHQNSRNLFSSSPEPATIARSNPFLRKPIWALDDVACDDETDRTASVASHSTATHLPSLPSVSDLVRTGERLDGDASPFLPSRVGQDLHADSKRQWSSRETLERHLSLFDLVSLGIGGTIGSGIFVLSGLVANQYAGPAVTLSWALAGVAATLSGVCYAELAGQIPTAGSSYAYVYAAIGELPAFVAAAGLTLEYVISGAAVARSWGDKFGDWLVLDAGMSEEWVEQYMRGWPAGFNPMAAAVSMASLAVLIMGVRESRTVTNFFTVAKLMLIFFMIAGGMTLMKASNFSPYIPPQYGIMGVARGTTSCFFGYIGFDEICCMAGEAKNPRKNLPRAILLTLGCVTLLYILASAVLCGMLPYQNISTTSGFPDAFAQNGAVLSSQLTSFGEVFTLPIVVLVSLMAQPRLMYALAKDGLVPKFFAKIDASGNLMNGTVISGLLMVFIASFVPFNKLDDMISAGILICFSLTNASLVLMRLSSPTDKPYFLEKQIGLFGIFSFLLAYIIVHCAASAFGKGLAIVLCLFMTLTCLSIKYTCPESMNFGGQYSSFGPAGHREPAFFRAPFVPILPCTAIFLNIYLLVRLELDAIMVLFLYFLATISFYFMYGAKHSSGNNCGWKIDGKYSQVVREISLL